MVKFQDATLDRTFAALSDPTRRALLAQLSAERGLSVSTLAKPFPVSLPAIMKHLDVLFDAGLITRVKTGRTVDCRLNAAPMEAAMQWLNRYERFWSAGLDRLEAFLEEDACLPPQPLPLLLQETHRASRSSDGSTRRRKKSTPRGPNRES